MNDVLFGVFMLALGAVLAARTRGFLLTAKRAQGEVVGFESRLDSEGDLIHTPVFAFALEDGRVITASSARGGSVVQRHRVGARLRLVYNPRDPNEVWPDSGPDVWFAPVACWAVAALVLIKHV